MTADSIESLKSLYAAASDENKPEVIFGAEALVSGELIDFLIDIATNIEEYDLARIEAIKAMGLAGLNIPSHQEKVVQTLIELANEDKDYDIQSYSLQALSWYPTFTTIPTAISSLTSPDKYIVVRDAAMATLLSQKSNPQAIKLLTELANDPELGNFIKNELSN